MKRIIIVALLAAQIVTACGQNGATAAKNGNETAHDTAWYANRMNELVDSEKALANEYRTITAGAKTPEVEARVKELYAADDTISDKIKSLTLEIVRKFKNTNFPAHYLSGNIVYSFSYDELKEICDSKAVYLNAPQMDKPKAIMMAMLASLGKRHPGIQYHELTMQDMDGKTVKLSDYVGKGKYVLVDFWASWCGPCRMEMPNVVKAYADFKDKNFEIVGVSFDQKKDAWTAAVKQLGMTWPQMSDLKGWKCAANEVYGVNSIPSNVLIDPQGKIIATDLRGEQLQAELAKVLR